MKLKLGWFTIEVLWAALYAYLTVAMIDDGKYFLAALNAFGFAFMLWVAGKDIKEIKHAVR